MSYGAAAAFQTAIYQLLLADPEVSAHVGADIFDAAPSGTVPPMYVSLGPEDVRAAGDKTGRGAVHRFVVSVVNDGGGFHAVKLVAGAVSDALHEAKPALSRGRVIGLRFLRATAKRIGDGSGRQIDLRFEARLEDE